MEGRNSPLRNKSWGSFIYLYYQENSAIINVILSLLKHIDLAPLAAPV